MKREKAEVLDEVVVSAPPNGIRVIFREFKKDKIKLSQKFLIDQVSDKTLKYEDMFYKPFKKESMFFKM